MPKAKSQKPYVSFFDPRFLKATTTAAKYALKKGAQHFTQAAHRRALKASKGHRMFTTTPSKANPFGRRSRATAMKGVYRGRVKGLRKRKQRTKFASKGCEYLQEANDVTTDNHCVYVGHGVAVIPARATIWGAVYRSLLSKAGIDIQQWQNAFNAYGTSTARYNIHYSLNDGTAEASIDISMPTPATFEDHVNTLVAQVDAIQDTSPTETVIWRRITIFPDNSGYASTVLDLTYYQVEFECSSKMKIQNRTSARKDVGEADGDDDSADNVEACPLTGKLYSQTLWKNGFSVRNPRSTFGSRDSLNCTEKGVIEGLSSTMDTNDVRNVFRKPPAPYFLGDKLKTTVAKLDPGAIKDTKFFFSCKMNLNTLLRKISNSANGLTANSIQDFGKAQVFALEKELSIGAEDNTPIRVGFQVDQIYRACGKKYTVKANPIHSVTY